jgi:hypothetical protein
MVANRKRSFVNLRHQSIIKSNEWIYEVPMHNTRGRNGKMLDIFGVSGEEQNAGAERERLEAVINPSKCVTIPAL